MGYLNQSAVLQPVAGEPKVTEIHDHHQSEKFLAIRRPNIVAFAFARKRATVLSIETEEVDTFIPPVVAQELPQQNTRAGHRRRFSRDIHSSKPES